VGIAYTSAGKFKCSGPEVSRFARRPKAIGFGQPLVSVGQAGLGLDLGERVWVGFGDKGFWCNGCFGKVVWYSDLGCVGEK
jgi:hypothetical protein